MAEKQCNLIKNGGGMSNKWEYVGMYADTQTIPNYSSFKGLKLYGFQSDGINMINSCIIDDLPQFYADMPSNVIISVRSALGDVIIYKTGRVSTSNSTKAVIYAMY